MNIKSFSGKWNKIFLYKYYYDYDNANYIEHLPNNSGNKFEKNIELGDFFRIKLHQLNETLF